MAPAFPATCRIRDPRERTIRRSDPQIYSQSEPPTLICSRSVLHTEIDLTKVVRLTGLMAMGAVYSWWVSSTTPFTVGADAAVATGFVLLALPAGASFVRGQVRFGDAGREPHSAVDPTARRPLLRAWVVALLFLLAVELFTYFAGWSGNRHEFPTISSLYDTAARSQAAKAAIVFAWMALGWGLFHRGATRVGREDGAT
jgi:hypothetical protein